MRKIKITVFGFLIWMLSGFAQQPAQQQANAPLAPPKAYKFETTTQLVIVNVDVKDKSGKAIEGLKSGDFTVFEDGKPQQVKVFEYQRLEDAVLPEPTLTPRKPATPAAPATATAPTVQPAVQSAIAPAKPGEIKYRDRRLLAMYFDFQGMPIDDQIRVQSGALKFINSQMTSSDVMAILSYTGELKVLQDFTSDRDALVETVKKLVIGESSDMANTVSDDSSEDTGAAYTADDSEFNIFNTDRELFALESAVKMLSNLPEKKAMIYFASGVARSGMDNDAQIRSTINAAIKANVSFYPVDARGLVATAPMGNAGRGSPGGGGMMNGGAGRAMSGNLQGSQDTLYALANDTGGKAFLDHNDLSLGIVQAQKDIDSYYILGYYSANAAMDGKYRKIKVAINNNPTAKLDYRSGYFASKQFKQFNSSDRERQLQEALALGDPITDLAMALETDYFRMGQDRYTVPISIKIPGTDIELAKRGGSESTRLDFIGQIKDAKGQLAGTVRDYITVKLKTETAAELAKRTVAYDTVFTLMPGTYTIKMLARENETGKVGTFEAKFVVPDLGANTRVLPISSVVLSNQREKVESTIGTAGPNRRLFQMNPLVRGGEKLIPSVTRVFRKDQNMYVFLEAYEPDAQQEARPVTASLAFYRGKVKAFESEPIQVTEGLNPMTKALPLRFSLPLAKLEPGMYTCQVTVLDPGVQRFATWRAPIVLLP
jgi:VWFA-related protein